MEIVSNILFFVFAIAAVFSAVMVITRRNPVNSAVWLLLTFIWVAALYILLNAPFIAMVQITVYAGAILVLILFVVMLLNLGQVGSGAFDITSGPQRVAAILVGAVLIGELLAIFLSPKSKAANPGGIYTDALIDKMGHAQALGTVLFSEYVWPFEVVSILLIVAIIGVVILTQRKKPADTAGDQE